ncbi:MAG: hypothetical protein HWN67_10580, partial [Candidatus Helarchaeota archaeon]|nr:hypothetical protein [Candidatus Helarchaeota archaeon]
MENTTGFVLGLLAFISSIVLLFAPAMASLPILGMLVVLCTVININMCLLIMLGGIWNSKNLSGTGFGVGMGSWVGLIVILILSIIGLQQMVSDASGSAVVYMLLYNVDKDSFFLMLFILEMGSAGYMRMGITWDVAQIVITGLCLIFGSISFGLV